MSGHAWPRPNLRVEAFAPDWSLQTEQLLDLANEMLIYARHWEELRDPERAAMFHRATAAYALAAAQTQALGPLPTPAVFGEE